MRLEDINRIEHEKIVKEARDRRAAGKAILAGKTPPALPGVDGTDMLIAKPPEEKKALFDKLRESLQ